MTDIKESDIKESKNLPGNGGSDSDSLFSELNASDFSEGESSKTPLAEGVCYFCKGPCNPCSQACGSCIRRPMLFMNIYTDPEDVHEVDSVLDYKYSFLNDLKDAFKNVDLVLSNKPKKFKDGGREVTYNRRFYKKGAENLRRAREYFLKSFEEAEEVSSKRRKTRDVPRKELTFVDVEF